MSDFQVELNSPDLALAPLTFLSPVRVCMIGVGQLGCLLCYAVVWRREDDRLVCVPSVASLFTYSLHFWSIIAASLIRWRHTARRKRHVTLLWFWFLSYAFLLLLCLALLSSLGHSNKLRIPCTYKTSYLSAMFLSRETKMAIIIIILDLNLCYQEQSFDKVPLNFQVVDLSCFIVSLTIFS